MAEKLVEFLTPSGSSDTYKIAPKWDNVQGKPSSFNPSSHSHDVVRGIYTSNGGAQKPSYIGANATRFNMMNSFINSSGSSIQSFDGYADVVMMNNYSWSDVPYATAIAVQKTNGIPRAWIAAGPQAGWAGATELVTKNNLRGSLTKEYITNALGYTPPTSDTNTHHTAKLVAAASTSATGNASSSGSVYLNVIENGAVRSSHKIAGSGATSVSCDANGNITISSTNTTYSFNGAVSTIKDSNLTASRALVSNSSGKVAVSDTTLAELGYVHGVTSSIQTQLNNKAAENHTHKSLVWNTF